ncbi:MAG: ABC transporter permease [Bacteroidales bacterium]|nr:ABC transporter permease [Bacteroidales bacterium]
MLNNFKPFIKHLINNKVYTFITIIGFAVSLAFVLLLSVYIKHELSVNNKQKNKERIYRLCSDKADTFAPPIGEWVQNTVPEVESYTRVSDEGGILSTDNNKKYKFKFLLADSTFFNIFTFNLFEGDKETALKAENSVVLTKEFAKKLFGNQSPIGKQLILNLNTPCTVTGVVEDISEKSFFKKYDAIINFRLIKKLWGWDELLRNPNSCSFGFYFLAKPNADLRIKEPEILKIFKKDFWVYKQGVFKTVRFEPLDDVYFSTIISNGEINQNSKKKIAILSVIVVLILILAIINYLNLTIAQSSFRVKEIAIKKLHGSSRKRLILQHIFETLILCIVAFFVAIFLSFLVEPVFNKLLGTSINLNDEFISINVMIFLIFILLIGMFSGIVPALIITRLKAVDVLKGGFTFKTKTSFSKILIIFQYTVVITLISASIIINQQTKFLLNKNLGFHSKNILMLDNNIDINQKEALRDEFLKIPGIKAVSFVAGTPVDGGNNNTFTYNNKPVSFQIFVVDSAFWKMTGLKSKPTGTAYTQDGIWINKEAIRELELDSLPQVLKIGKNNWNILGIVNDFNFRPLHQKIGAAMIKQMNKNDYPWNILLQIEGNNQTETINRLKEVYLNFTGGIPFDYEFFDTTLQKWYEKEQKTSKIVEYFAMLAITISVMGIFAMSMFYNQQKSKEIGIRRVNGATVNQIIKMLSFEFLKLVITAFILSVPIAYYLMNRWLENFAYKINLSWWIFILARLIAAWVALTTVSWQIFSTARKNPALILRYE